MEKDFFISYTGAAVAWAEWLAQTLEDAGYQTVLQAWDFRPGENFIQRMSEALTEAKRVVALLSPAYFGSEYTRDEWTAALVRARGQADRLLPVRIAPCRLPPLLANRIYIDLVDLQETQAKDQLTGRRAARPGQTGGPTDLPRCWPASGRRRIVSRPPTCNLQRPAAESQLHRTWTAAGGPAPPAGPERH
jgi:hypothetical protein